MCVQCYMAASTAVGAAAGSRVWIVASLRERLTPRRRRALSATLLALGVIAAGLGLGGTG